MAITFQATALAGETYQWFKGTTALVNGTKYQGVRTSKLEIRNLQFADTSSVYYCVVTGGCAAPRTRNVAVLIPRINITQQPQSAAICPGASLELVTSASASGGDQALAYQWVTAHGGALAETSNIKGVNQPTLRILSATLADTGRYYCLITGYPSTLTRISNTAVVSMPQTPLLVRDLRGPGGDTSLQLCEGGVTTLFIDALGSVQRYEWFLNGSLLATTSQNTLLISQAGRYTARVVTPCDNVAAETRSVDVDVRQRPRIALQPVVNTVVNEGEAFKLELTIATGTRPLRYQWYRDGNALAGATDSVLSVTAAQLTDAGRYLCTIGNVCGIIESGPAIVKVRRPISVSVDDEKSLLPSIVLTPNPFQGQAVVRITSEVDAQARLDVIDMQGRVVTTLHNGVLAVGVTSIALDGKTIPSSGAYVLRITTADGTSTLPIRLIH